MHEKVVSLKRKEVFSNASGFSFAKKKNKQSSHEIIGEQVVLFAVNISYSDIVECE